MVLGRSSWADEPLDRVDERLEREWLGQVAGDANSASRFGLTAVALVTTTGGAPGRGQGGAAKEVPAGVAGQVQVEQDERRAAGPPASAAVAASADAASSTT